MGLTVHFESNRHFMRFFVDPPTHYSIRVLLGRETVLRFENTSRGVETRDITLVPIYLRHPYDLPYGAIRVYNDFNLPDGDLFVAPYDPRQTHTDWEWLLQESARNSQVANAANAHVEPPWDAAAWPANPPAITLEEALSAIHAHAQGAAAAAAVARPATAPPTTAPRAVSEPRSYTPR